MSDNESESRETVADIVADIRERAENAMRNGERLVHNEAVANMLTFVADRIEAAAKRDEERAVEHATRHAEAVARDNCRDCVHNPSGRNYEGGNAAAMREALVSVRALIADEPDGTPMIDAMKATIEAALAAPVRNFDIGTPEEHTRRMVSEFCCQYECYELPSGKHCPLYHEGIDCRFTWAQMPYKAEEGATDAT